MVFIMRGSRKFCQVGVQGLDGVRFFYYFYIVLILPKGKGVCINTVIYLLQARASSRIISVHGDRGGPLLEATSARKVCSSNSLIRVAILKC